METKIATNQSRRLTIQSSDCVQSISFIIELEESVAWWPTSYPNTADSISSVKKVNTLNLQKQKVTKKVVKKLRDLLAKDAKDSEFIFKFPFGDPRVQIPDVNPCHVAKIRQT